MCVRQREQQLSVSYLWLHFGTTWGRFGQLTQNLGVGRGPSISFLFKRSFQVILTHSQDQGSLEEQLERELERAA